VALLKDTRLGW